MTAAVVSLATTPGLTAGACAALNVSRASVYRRRDRGYLLDRRGGNGDDGAATGGAAFQVVR
jgi:hypothetical protein